MKRDQMVRALAERATGTVPVRDAAPAAKTGVATTPKRAEKPARAPKATPRPPTTKRDPRLPAPGTVLERAYKGKTYRVEVLERGFKHEGKEWRSLTAVALAVTGYKAISGTLFFGVAQRKRAVRTVAPSSKPARAPRAAKAKAATAKGGSKRKAKGD